MGCPCVAVMVRHPSLFILPRVGRGASGSECLPGRTPANHTVALSERATDWAAGAGAYLWTFLRTGNFESLARTVWATGDATGADVLMWRCSMPRLSRFGRLPPGGRSGSSRVVGYGFPCLRSMELSFWPV